MKIKTISILGCGWLGLPLAQDLIRAGYHIKGSTTTPAKVSTLQGFGIEPFLLDSNEKLNGEQTSDFFNADVLFLNIPFRRSLADPVIYKKQIHNVIEQVEKSTVQFLIFASSTSVYPDDIGIAREDEPIVPANERAQVLLGIEGDLLSSKSFSATIMRFSGLYGGSRQLGKFLSGKKQMTNGDSVVNLIHLDDCVALVRQIIEQKITGEIFNACSDAHPTRKELYQSAAKALGLEPPEFIQHGPPRTKIVSNEKIKNALSYSFKYPNPLNN